MDITGRVGSRYEDYLFSRTQTDPSPTTNPVGASGYFSAPTDGLDPKLFNGYQLKNDIRQSILNLLYQFWDPRYILPREWSTVWMAGSGASYQWSAEREAGTPGDLDILIGVDHPRFYELNPGYRGIPEADVDHKFNQEFFDTLQPKTSNWHGYEVTFYVNPKATDIRAINPYAAYNLSNDSWTVEPNKVPPHNEGKDWWGFIDAEASQANTILANYTAVRSQAIKSPFGSPSHVNNLEKLRGIVGQGKDLFDSIHNDRKIAFAPGGEGYNDFYNFRWQAHKKNGIGVALRKLRNIAVDAEGDLEKSQYGYDIKDAHDVLTDAGLYVMRER
jgi:hypothetical protein